MDPEVLVGVAGDDLFIDFLEVGCCEAYGFIHIVMMHQFDRFEEYYLIFIAFPYGEDWDDRQVVVECEMRRAAKGRCEPAVEGDEYAPLAGVLVGYEAGDATLAFETFDEASVALLGAGDVLDTDGGACFEHKAGDGGFALLASDGGEWDAVSGEVCARVFPVADMPREAYNGAGAPGERVLEVLPSFNAGA